MELPWKFRAWSEIYPSEREKLQPTILWRCWNDLSVEEKGNMLQYFKSNRYFYGEEIHGAETKGEKALILAIIKLNNNYKRASLARRFLENRSISSAYQDFIDHWTNADESVVLEILSYYAASLFEERIGKAHWKEKDESDRDYEERYIDWRMEPLDRFRKVLNEIFEQFSVNVYLTRAGFIRRQEKKIIEDMYDPVINCLSNPRWKKAERDLQDALKEFSHKTKNGYSGCITHCYSAIQAFLNELTQSEKIDANLHTLIKEAKRKNLIPSDDFSEKMISSFEEIINEMRKKYGHPHPKDEYADEHNALLALNITMVFLQHCMTHI